MADISIYVAAISAAAGVGGATLSQYVVSFRESKQAKRDRQERYEEAKRQACLNLLKAAIDLRTQIANNVSYRGQEMGTRLEVVRGCAAAARLHAADVSLLAPESVAIEADRLAAAANSLAEWAGENTDLHLGALIRPPDFTVLDGAVTTFRTRAREDARP